MIFIVEDEVLFFFKVNFEQQTECNEIIINSNK